MAKRTKKPQKQAPATPAPKSIIKADYKRNHKVDELARSLRRAVEGDDGKIDVEKLRAVCQENGLDASRWSHLNVGQQRMNAGNVLRARVKKGEAVVIGGVAFKAPVS